jgi:glycine/D-amino acid oxidase-like deaminating enzyme/nitrite reductase/ring-hydroxylating ferredoxin subunit
MATCPYGSFPPLEGDVEADVAIVGAGIVGILTAAVLKQAGFRVALLESRQVAGGVTGYTTAKLTAVHTTIYSKLRDGFGREKAHLYAKANSDAIRWAVEQVAMQGIACDFTRLPLTLYVDRPDEREILEKEHAAATEAGLECELLSRADAPFPTAAALRFPGQAQFHIRRFLEPFVQSIPGNGSAIYENTRVVDVDEGDPCEVRTERGTVRARFVVLATMFPIFDPGFYWARLSPYRDYAMAVRLSGPLPSEMLVGAGETSYTYRTQPDPGGDLLVVSGLDQKEGEHTDKRRYYTQMETYLREHLPVSEVAYYWSAQDYKTLDGVPYIGRISGRAERVFVATGFDGWGMSTGIVSAHLLSDLILGRKSPYEDLYNPNRFKPGPSVGQLAENVVTATKHLVVERVSGAAKLHADTLPPGEGSIFDTDEGKAGVYKDEGGRLHVLSPYCTHMGCQLSWNSAERSWDCGCHGSRFDIHGKVLQGPAVKDLEPKPIDE